MDFWDGMGHTFIMPSTTAEERTAIWDAVAIYIQERLLWCKGVRIPSLGVFDSVPTQIQIGDEAVTVQRPVFYLARNLVVAHNLTDNKDYLPGNKELRPLKYHAVAKAASVSRQKVENCIQGTITLLSYCLSKGKNVALVLKDIGVLLIEGRKVQMKFFCNLLERMSGKENWEKAVSKGPKLLDTVASQEAALASLTVSGHVVTFPKFDLQFVLKPPPREPLKHWRRVPGEDNWKKIRNLRAVRQDTKVDFAELSSLTASSRTDNEYPQFQESKAAEKRKKSRVRQLPAIPEDYTRKKQPVNSQLKGKPSPHGKALKQSQNKAAKSQKRRVGGKGGKNIDIGCKLRSTNSEARMRKKPVFILLPPSPTYVTQLLKSRPEAFWSLLREPQKTILAGYSSDPSTLLPLVHEESRPTQRQSLQTTATASMSE